MGTKNSIMLFLIISSALSCGAMPENIDQQAFAMPNIQQLIKLMETNNLGSLPTETSIIEHMASKTLSGSDIASIFYITQWELAHTSAANQRTIQHNLELLLLSLTSKKFLGECRYFQKINALKIFSIRTTLEPRAITSRFHPSLFATRELRCTKYTHDHEGIKERLNTYFFNTLQEKYPSIIPAEIIDDLKEMLYKKLTGGVTLPELEIFIQQACSTCLGFFYDVHTHEKAAIAATILEYLDTTLSKILQPTTFTKLLVFRRDYYHKMSLLGYQEYYRYYIPKGDESEDYSDELEEL